MGTNTDSVKRGALDVRSLTRSHPATAIIIIGYEKPSLISPNACPAFGDTATALAQISLFRLGCVRNRQRGRVLFVKNVRRELGIFPLFVNIVFVVFVACLGPALIV